MKTRPPELFVRIVAKSSVEILFEVEDRKHGTTSLWRAPLEEGRIVGKLQFVKPPAAIRHRRAILRLIDKKAKKKPTTTT